MAARITILHVAQRAGVGRSTVSRALAGHPACAPATRDRIRRIAAEMGYVPDPALAALVAHRENIRRKPTPFALAIVSDDVGGSPGGYTDSVWRAVETEAAAFGYGRVGRFCSAGQAPESLARILRARGVRGIVWGWLKDDRYLGAFPWDRFVHIGFPLPVVHPSITCVRDDSLRTVYDAVRAAFARGFRRPGLMLMTAPGSWNDRFQAAGWLLAHAEAGVEPTAIWRSIDEARWDVRRWFRSQRPDLLIGNVDYVFHHARELLRRRMPPYLNLLRPEPGYPGFDCSEETIGRVIVRELDRQIRHNETGLRERPPVILVRRHFLGWDSARTS